MNARLAYEEFEAELARPESGCLCNYGQALSTHGVWLRFCARRALEAVGETATAEEFEAAFEREREEVPE